MNAKTYYYLLNVLDDLVNKKEWNLISAVNAFCAVGYAFSLKKLEQGIIEVYPLNGEFYIIEFKGY